jgi:hypothetical protein
MHKKARGGKKRASVSYLFHNDILTLSHKLYYIELYYIEYLNYIEYLKVRSRNTSHVVIESRPLF